MDSFTDRYELEARIGVGGSASVFRAQGPDGPVALKVLHPDLVEEQDQVERFVAEGELLSTLDHFGLPRFLDSSGPDEVLPWFALELVDGPPLSSTDARELGLVHLVECALEVCDTLGYLHRQGIVHRDVKPANILVDQRGCARLIDLGIARRVDLEWTIAGSVMGTPTFMSPEQAVDPRSVDARSDLYSLGLCLYALSTRRTAMELSFAHLRDEGLSHVPVELRSTVDRATRADPDERFQDDCAFQDALARVLEGLA